MFLEERFLELPFQFCSLGFVVLCLSLVLTPQPTSPSCQTVSGGVPFAFFAHRQIPTQNGCTGIVNADYLAAAVDFLFWTAVALIVLYATLPFPRNHEGSQSSGTSPVPSAATSFP